MPLSEATIDLLALREVFRSPGGLYFKLVDGELIVWQEQMDALLAAEGMSQLGRVEFLRAANTFTVEGRERARKVFPGTPERFNELLVASTFLRPRDLIRESVRKQYATAA